MSQEWIIRTENDDDFDSIHAVVLAASGEPEAADLVRNLRTDGAALLSLVAEMNSRVVGHIMMSRMSIETGAGNVPAVALAPLMVDPASQNSGIGSALTRAALQQSRENGESIVLVLGHPNYYPRFGFSADAAQHLQIPFKLTVPGAFMALELKPAVLSGVSGRVRYSRAFGLPPEWTVVTVETNAAVVIQHYEDRHDEAAVADLWLRAGKVAYPFLPQWQTLTADTALKLFREEIAAKCDVWVAVKGSCVVAYLAMKGSYLDRLYVDPLRQREGYGTRLLNFAKSISPEGLQLHTHQENLPARAFYEKQGFRPVRFGISPPPECAPDVEYHWSGRGLL